MPVVLALNTGSSSLKFACYGPGEVLLYQGAISRIGQPSGSFSVKDGQKNPLVSVERPFPTISDACEAMFHWIATQPDALHFSLIGHRIVHGGPTYTHAVRIDEEVLRVIESLAAYAPEHIPPALKAIAFAQHKYPQTPHVACFDTAFHRTMPAVARTLPLPQEYTQHGLEKYGFHGLSYEFLLSQLLLEDRECTLRSKIVIAHLGHGASCAAVLDGRCVETTMGFSPTGGFPMSTRTGDLDPEVVLYLLQHENVPLAEMKHLLNQKAGLLAISGYSDDQKDLLDREHEDERCRFAVEYFVYHVCKHIAALCVSLNGLDTLVFSAGIGEKSDVTRERICARLAFLGVKLDAEKNAQHASIISAEDSAVTVRVMPTNEEVIIARQTATACGQTLLV